MKFLDGYVKVVNIIERFFRKLGLKGMKKSVHSIELNGTGKLKMKKLKDIQE